MRRLHITFALYACCVCVAIVVTYPRLFTSAGAVDYHGRPTHPRAHAPTRGLAEVDGTAPVTFEYRLDAVRRNRSDEPFHMLATTPAWSVQPLNVGIHDASKASPAVDASGVYVGADSSWFYAFDLAGALRWKLKAGSAARGIHSTAALDTNIAYVGAYNGTLYALRKRDGELAWALRLGDTIGSSPVIVGDSVYVAVETFSPADGFVARVRRSTGEVVWLSSWLGEQSHSSPTIDERAGVVLVGSNNAFFRALDLASGIERWRVPTRGAVKDTACALDGVAYFTSIVGTLYAVRVADGRELWHTALPGRSRSSPTNIDGILIVGTDDGSLNGVSAATGAPTWQIRTEFKDMIGSAVATRDGIAWIGCGATSVCALRATTGEILQRLELGAALSSVPTLWHGSLFVATDPLGPLARFDPAI